MGERLPPPELPVLSRRVRPSFCLLLVCAGVHAACTRVEPPPAAATTRGPAYSLIPAGPFGAAARRGRAILSSTHDSLRGHVGNTLRCTSRPLAAGRRVNATW